MLSADEASALIDRTFEVRCAAEDVATAVSEGAATDELVRLCDELISRAKDAERLR